MRGGAGRYIVLCSDGVFEFLSNREVMDIVESHEDPFEAARELVEAS
jgi:serine/threonine protein phosphatase PrpC